MEKLTNEHFADLGFDISQEPFTRNGIKVFKNYVRDGSGKHEGYIIEFPCIAIMHTDKDLEQILLYKNRKNMLFK